MSEHDVAKGGAVFRLEKDEHGQLRAVPTEESYLERAGANMPAVTETPAPATLDADRRERSSWSLYRQTRPDDGKAPSWQDLSPAEKSLWLDSWDTYDAGTLSQVFERLSSWIATTFEGAHIWRSPGRTGQSLLLHTLPWGKDHAAHRFPQIDAQLGRLIAATSPQHRLEQLAQPRQKMTQYRYYDARMAHIAYLRRLPVIGVGGLQHDNEPVCIRYRAGRYRVELTVPEGWAHIGLAPRRNERVAGLWEWPSRPGESWECWLDEREMRLLSAPGDGLTPWPHVIRERLLFAVEGESPEPARELLSRLAPALEQLEQAEKTPVNRIKRAMLRQIPLTLIGDWLKRGNTSTRDGVLEEELTEDDAQASLILQDDGTYTVTDSTSVSSYQEHWRRPEWAHSIYAQERYEATRRALQLPRSALLAIRGDALHLADTTPSGALWEDKQKLGNYRLKASRDFTTPRAVPELLSELLDASESEELL